MSDFSTSTWANEEFSNNYLKKADVYVFERQRLFAFLAEIHAHVFNGKTGIRACDLGCGDGAVTEVLLKADKTISATLLDASPAMLKKAHQRLAAYEHVDFIQAGFDEILKAAAQLPEADLYVSSMAIHHLEMHEKAALFRLVFERLAPGGLFVNIDVVLPPSAELEDLYFTIWGTWMQAMMEQAGITDEHPSDVMRQYKDPASPNRPDTLQDQLQALDAAGFQSVDCYFKNGIFVIFGGMKR